MKFLNLVCAEAGFYHEFQRVGANFVPAQPIDFAWGIAEAGNNLLYDSVTEHRVGNADHGTTLLDVRILENAFNVIDWRC